MDAQVRRRAEGVIGTPGAEGRVQGLVALDGKAPIGPPIGRPPLLTWVLPLLLRLGCLPLSLERAILGPMAMQPTLEACPRWPRLRRLQACGEFISPHPQHGLERPPDALGPIARCTSLGQPVLGGLCPHENDKGLHKLPCVRQWVARHFLQLAPGQFGDRRPTKLGQTGLKSSTAIYACTWSYASVPGRRLAGLAAWHPHSGPMPVASIRPQPWCMSRRHCAWVS